MRSSAYWHTLDGVTFEPTPCGGFIGVRLAGEVVGTLAPDALGYWRAHGRLGAFHSAPTINECVGWMIAHRDRLVREGN